MQIKKYLLASILAYASSHVAQAQDLIQQVPAEAQFVGVINNRAIVNHRSFDKINSLLTQLGAFEELNKDRATPLNSISDLDIDFKRNAYVYRTTTDSTQYVGILVPLKNGLQNVEDLFKNFKTLPDLDGYHRLASENLKTQAAWNNNSLFFLIGDVQNSYFEDPEVAERYGIELPAAMAYDDGDWEAVTELEDLIGEEVDDYYYTEEAEEAEAAEEAEGYEEAEEYVAADSTSVLGIDAEDTDWDDESYDEENSLYTDSAYQAELARNIRNQEIKDSLLANWIDVDFLQLLKPAKAIANQKEILNFDANKTLARVWVNKFGELYANSIPYDMMRYTYGVKIAPFNFGYEDASFDLIQEKNTLKIATTIGLDKDLARNIAPVYNGKLNKKFANYIPADHIGYLSLNISTEAYLQQVPNLMERWYAPFLGEYGDIANIVATAFSIALDEKAIAKTFQGDQVLVLNGLQKKEREYIDYEFDEDGDYTEVTKTKQDYEPSFLWMFTAKDQRLYKKSLALAQKLEYAQELGSNFYRVHEKVKNLSFYAYLKDDMVLISNDSTLMHSIQQNQFKGFKDAQLAKDLQKNTFNGVIRTKSMIKAIDDMDIPLLATWQKTLDEMSNYGDLHISAEKMKKNKVRGEISISFPNAKEDALSYLLDQALDKFDTNKRVILD